MANTTNFGWETPDDTDLVKDGAAAMRTLGNAIDTSLVDLKGGTTNQVLAKNSNTDMDFKWVETDDTNAIQNAIVDAKGDLIAASAADTPARLAVGNNGDSLVANDSASVGLSWNPPVGSLANPVINGGFDIWQRGTSFTAKVTGTNYGADRWDFYSANTSNIASRQTTGDTTNLPNIQYCLRAARPSGNTGTDLIYLNTSVESVNAIPFAGKSITLSFYARAGANYSAASGNLNVRLDDGTGTDQRMVNGYTGASQRINQNVVLTTTWQRFALTGSIRSTATEFGFWFSSAPIGTAGAADYYEVTGVQIDVGTWTASTAPTFRRAGGNIAQELAACQRYYYRISPEATGRLYGTGWNQTTTIQGTFIPFPVTMRIRPTALEQSGTASHYQVAHAATVTTCSVVPAYSGNTTKFGADVSLTVASGLTAGQGSGAYSNSADGYLGWSAEL